MDGRHSYNQPCGRMRIVCNSCTVNLNSKDGWKVGLRGRAPLEGRMWHGAGCAATGEVRVWWCSRTPGPSACLPWSGSSRTPHRTEPYSVSPIAYPAKVLRISLICAGRICLRACVVIRPSRVAAFRPRGVSKFYQRSVQF